MAKKTVLSNYEETEICRLCRSGLGTIDVGSLFNVSPTPIVRILEKNNIKRRKSSVSYDEESFWNNVELCEPNRCWKWRGGFRSSGYGHTSRYRKDESAHRLAWEFWNNKKIPKGMFACHKCDNPACCNPNHIFIGTPKENSEDMVRKNRQVSGERHWCSKLTKEQVSKIKEMRNNGETLTAIGKIFGITHGMVGHIASGRNWKNI